MLLILDYPKNEKEFSLLGLKIKTMRKLTGNAIAVPCVSAVVDGIIKAIGKIQQSQFLISL